MSKKPKIIILRTAGTNCDKETEFAFKSLGAEVELVHINQLAQGEKRLSVYQIMAIPGGFTYGDDLGSGKILANELNSKLKDDMLRFISQGKLIIGICNGFQVLVKAGLLPRINGEGKDRQATLTINDSAKFEDRWVYMKPLKSKCVWTKGIKKIIYLPVAHGEGKFIPKDKDVLKKIWKNEQVVFQYGDEKGNIKSYPYNPNGSIDNIAGICDTTGRIFGLMPHPERHFLPTHHPRWFREGLQKQGDGAIIFKKGIDYAQRLL